MINPILVLCILTWLGAMVGVVFTATSGCGTTANPDILPGILQNFLQIFGG